MFKNSKEKDQLSKHNKYQQKTGNYKKNETFKKIQYPKLKIHRVGLTTDLTQQKKQGSDITNWKIKAIKTDS